MLISPMPAWGTPEWPGAVWIGVCDRGDLDGDAPLVLEQAEGYQRARILVRDGRALLGFVTVPITAGSVSREALRDGVAGVPRRAVEADPPTPPITVVICTRDHPKLLEGALQSVLASDYPCFEVIVVDNACSTNQTRELVENCPDDRVRYVSEPRPGLSRGRNRGLRAAAYDYVAFIDDDVIVDKYWLTALATGFARGEDVALVCAFVVSGELRTSSQAWFDNRMALEKVRPARVYRLADPPAEIPLFPFNASAYGTGACYSVRREVFQQIGGLDVVLGLGTPTMGGEDIDLFVRTICAEWAVAVEPEAVIWHRYRDDIASLEATARGYGAGLGAWLTKTALNPKMLRHAIGSLPVAAKRLFALASGNTPDPEQNDRDCGLPDGYTRKLGRLEFVSVFSGPVRFARSSLAARRT